MPKNGIQCLAFGVIGPGLNFDSNKEILFFLADKRFCFSLRKGFCTRTRNYNS